MLRSATTIAIAALAWGSVALAQQSAPAPPTSKPSAATAATICQMVVSAEQGAKPYQLCLTEAEWDAKKVADAKDANRIVCHYEEEPGTRFRSAKVCMPASQWAEQRRLDREAVERIQRDSCVNGQPC